uniref:Uncharacterized protein n=1 Tax=Anguilla anguilla TaxID=7936 RepID=A0A0E9RWL9_ANGAN
MDNSFSVLGTIGSLFHYWGPVLTSMTVYRGGDSLVEWWNCPVG